MSIQLRDGLANQPLDLILEDLLVRFLVNVPDEDLSSIERVFFQVEEAQWFYTDFLRVLNPTLPHMKMKTFAPKLLKKCPLIWKWGEPADAIARFGKYKSTIPVRGVALLNKDLTKVLLVKGTESNSWSFPRGKISKDEQDLDCAIREVAEETGFDATGYIDEDNFIERTIRGKNYKIYLAKNVPEDYKFEPIARHEIAQISWHDLKTVQKKSQGNANQYFILSAILKPLMGWINRQRGGLNEQELMIQAEIKLKEFLGITAKQQSVANDAGRELLNILQGVSNNKKDASELKDAPTTTTPFANGTGVGAGHNAVATSLAIPYQQLLESSIPNFLQTAQFPYASGLPQDFPASNQAFFMPNFPPNAGPAGFIPPQSGQPPQAYQHLEASPQNIVQPNPQSFQKPSIRRSSEANSKELLSILNLGGGNSARKLLDLDIHPPATSEMLKNKSKAQSLLDLVNKKEPVDEKPKKIQILKRPERATTTPPAHGSPSPHIAPQRNTPIKEEKTNYESSDDEFFDSQPSTEPTKSTSSTPRSQPKISILKRQPNEEKPSSNGAVPAKASTELLGLLHRKIQPKEAAPSEILVKEEAQSNGQNSNGNKVSASSELLGLLHKKQPTQQPNQEKPPVVEPTAEVPKATSEAASKSHEEDNFEDFEDFEDFDSFEHNVDFVNNANKLLDIDSEDEEELASNHAGDQSSQLAAFSEQESGPALSFNHSEPSRTERANSKGFLDILNKSSKSPVELPQLPNGSLNPNLQEIYGSDPYLPTNVFNGTLQAVPNQSASKNLLSLLGKGPSKPSAKPLLLDDIESQQQVQPQQQQSQQQQIQPQQQQLQPQQQQLQPQQPQLQPQQQQLQPQQQHNHYQDQFFQQQQPQFQQQHQLFQQPQFQQQQSHFQPQQQPHFLPQQQLQFPPQQQFQHPSNQFSPQSNAGAVPASNPLLDMLRKPESKPAQIQSPGSQNGNSSAKDLLDILKGGSRNGGF